MIFKNFTQFMVNEVSILLVAIRELGGGGWELAEEV